MERLAYPFTNDTLFKAVFVKYPELLKNLVSQVLRVDPSDIREFRITNPEMTPEHLGEKFCRLDINMIVDGRRVNLEVQVNNEGDFAERALFYLARNFSSALPEGMDYTLLPQTIGINIVDFRLFGGEDCHSQFAQMEVTRHDLLTDRLVTHFYELPKIPGEIPKDDLLLLWLALFKAKTEEEMASIRALEVPIMQEAIEAYHNVSGSEEFRELERIRSKARHDEAQALKNAERRGVARGEARGEARANARWQSVVADRDAALAEQAALIKKLMEERDKKGE